MKPERWQQIDKLLDEALDQEPGQRRIFLEQACAGNAELRKEVEALREAHDKAGSFAERPAHDLVSQQPRQLLAGRKPGSYEIPPADVATNPDRLRRFAIGLVKQRSFAASPKKSAS